MRILIVASALALMACADDVGDVAVADEPACAELAEGDRPRGVTIAMGPDLLKEAGAVQTVRDLPRYTTFAGPGQPPLPIFLNFNGGTYSPGADNSRNNTSIVPRQTSTIGGYPYGNASRQSVVSCLTTMFAPYNVTMTETEPSTGEYVEAVIGGSPGDVGLPNGVGGVAPIDSFQCNIIPRAIVYAFAAVYGNNPQAICETAAQEIAHAFSLDHEFHCPDPMTYLGGCGAKTFRDLDAQCGEYEPRQCNCNRPSQNSVETLIQKLGAAGNIEPVDDPVPPTVQITAPADDATLPGDANITVTATANDDVGINAMELIWDFTNNTFPCPTSQAAVSCALSGGTATWTLRVSQGDRTFSVRATDAGGNAVTTGERTIHLGAGTPPPEGDATNPTVTISSPSDGATLPANGIMTVRANASDAGGLASVDLVWTYTGDTFPCPMTQQNISCEVDGDMYTWSLNVGVGTRAFQVRAVDLSNNQSTTAERTISLVDGAAPPDEPATGDDPAEPNDSATDAYTMRCGSTMDLATEPGDFDWFAIEAPEGTTVSVDVEASSGVGLTAFGADGETILGHVDDVVADGPVSVESPGPALLARVEPGDTAVAYRLTASCSDGSSPLPPGTDDAFEDNDDLSTATLSFCGQERKNLGALDVDVFKVQVRDGDTLTVSVTGEGIMAAIGTEDGDLLADEGAAPKVTGLTAGTYYVSVRATGAATGYDVTFTCEPGTVAGPRIQANAGGCGCDAGSPNGTAAVLALGAVCAGLRRRRRAERAAEN